MMPLERCIRQPLRSLLRPLQEVGLVNATPGVFKGVISDMLCIRCTVRLLATCIQTIYDSLMPRSAIPILPDITGLRIPLLTMVAVDSTPSGLLVTVLTAAEQLPEESMCGSIVHRELC